ncbi:uncharacterized protein LOC119710604 [Motacilla alba alba]|uniref:uncharacterized protein LOC119710604 n=1 Tax=Motacilla alba alba TaxID=1094192 RepID=UPI0018D596AD|nr:uncharacterized protein LOC119710604 [Motacilla alba alba]
MGVGLKDGSLWTFCLTHGAGGQSYRPPHPRNIPGILMSSGTGAWGVESPCRRDTARVTPRTLSFSWLGYTGILLPGIPCFKGQDWGDPLSWGSVQEGFGVQPKTIFVEVLRPARHVLQGGTGWRGRTWDILPTDTGNVWFISVPCSVPSKQCSEHVSSHLLLAPCFSLDGSLKPILVVETSVSQHRGDRDAEIFGKAKGESCKDMLEVLVWPTHELQPTLKKNLHLRRQQEFHLCLSQALGQRLSGLAVVSPVVGFPLPYGTGLFLCCAVCPDTDSSMKTCFMKTSMSEFLVLLRKGWLDTASGV